MRWLEPGNRVDRRFWIPGYRRKGYGLEYYEDAVGRRMAVLAVAWVAGLVLVGIGLVGGDETPAFITGGLVGTAVALGLRRTLGSWIYEGARRRHKENDDDDHD